MVIRTDTNTHLLLQPGQRVPGFALPNAAGDIVRLRAFRQRRPVLLAFLHSATCQDCRQWLSELATIRDELSYRNVHPLLIFPDDSTTLGAFQTELALPGDLLSDPYHATLSRFIRTDSQMTHMLHFPVLLVAVDRYSTSLGAWLADQPSQWPPRAEVMATFAFAEQEDCACGLPAWHDA